MADSAAHRLNEGLPKRPMRQGYCVYRSPCVTWAAPPIRDQSAGHKSRADHRVSGGLSQANNGKVIIALKTPYDDGTSHACSHLVSSPMALMGRLAARVPKPRVNLTRPTR